MNENISQTGTFIDSLCQWQRDGLFDRDEPWARIAYANQDDYHDQVSKSHLRMLAPAPHSIWRGVSGEACAGIWNDLRDPIADFLREDFVRMEHIMGPVISSGENQPPRNPADALDHALLELVQRPEYLESIRMHLSRNRNSLHWIWVEVPGMEHRFHIEGYHPPSQEDRSHDVFSITCPMNGTDEQRRIAESLAWMLERRFRVSVRLARLIQLEDLSAIRREYMLPDQAIRAVDKFYTKKNSNIFGALSSAEIMRTASALGFDSR